MLQFLGYVGCLILYAGSAFLAFAKKKPFALISLIALHFTEWLTVGYKTGAAYGKNALSGFCNCLVAGFFWWLPLKMQIKAETFTDEDFVRTDHDVNIIDD